MSKQTAVEWLVEQIHSDNYQRAFGQTYISDVIVEQAKEMERKQINQACYDGYYQEELYDVRDYYNHNYKKQS